MELLCPNCQKKLTVPEQYAGQLMRCPLCQGTFTVPAMPSTVAAEGAEPFGGLAPHKPETYGVASEPVAAAPALPPISAETPSAPSPPPPSTAAAQPAAPSAGYSRVCAMRFNPHVIQWLPIGLVVAFLLTFFPWTVAKANAWQLGFGTTIGGGLVEIKIPGHVLLVFFDLLSIFAALLAVASLLFTLKIIPYLPALKPFLPMRCLVVAAVAALAWFCLTLQCVMWLLGDGVIPLNVAGIVTWWLSTIAVVGAFIEFWLVQRGPGKPVPRMTLEW